MLDATYLKTVLDILSTHKVKNFKTNGLELSFHVEQEGLLGGQSLDSKSSIDGSTPSDPAKDSTQLIADTIKKQEESLPPDLRADNLMNQDNILNWSSPDQSQEQPMPLTGEQPL